MIMPIRPLNLERVQDHFELENTDEGVVSQAINMTDLYDLLKPYLSTVDYILYFDHGERIIRKQFVKRSTEPVTDFEPNEARLKKAIYYALKGSQYELQTLIDTTNIEYDPLENYYIKETIARTSSISGFTEYGEQNRTGTTSYGSFVNETITEVGEGSTTKEISKPEYTTLKTLNHGTVEKEFTKDQTLTTGSHTDTLTHNQGAESDTHETVFDKGKESSTTNSMAENTVSAYNTSDYQPNSKNTGNETVSNAGYMDTTNVTDNIGERQDKDTNIYGERVDKVVANDSEKTIGYVDSETMHYSEMTDIDTTKEAPRTTTATNTQNPHEVNQEQKTAEHRDDTGETGQIDTNREVRGRYGYTTIQAMLQAQRELANLSIVNRIVEIVLRAITEGVLAIW